MKRTFFILVAIIMGYTATFAKQPRGETMRTYPPNAIIADGKQLLLTMRTLYDAQPEDGVASAIVDDQALGITLIPEMTLWLYCATERDDISYFHICVQGEEPAEKTFEHIRDIWRFVIIPKTNPMQTIWRIYLLGKAYTQLPANWHGNYAQATLIFETSDIASIQPARMIVIAQNVHSKNAKVSENDGRSGIAALTEIRQKLDSRTPSRCWSFSAPITELRPKVFAIDKQTYQVVCCYWNDWVGLVRQTTTYIMEGSIIKNQDSKEEVLYPYHCGVRF